jgi:hypothetical protein
MAYKIKRKVMKEYIPLSDKLERQMDSMYKLKGKRLIGHSAKEDYYEDIEGNTYSFDGKKVKKL